MFRKQGVSLPLGFLSRPGHSTASMAADSRRGAKVPSIVSGDMTVRGELVGGGDLQVEGKVIGRIEVGNLIVAQSGFVEGDVVAVAVTISGSLRGSIRAGTVNLTSSARIQGDILHDVLAVEAGAQVEGQCRRITAKSEEKLLLPHDEMSD
jgi:cytoskeletal protein CcmA (bactofilin family)